MRLEVYVHKILMRALCLLQKTKPIAIGGMGIIATANCAFAIASCTLAHALLCQAERT